MNKPMEPRFTVATIHLHSDCQASILDEVPHDPVPIPLNEPGLPTVGGEKIAVAGNKRQSLEGAVFDNQGNLFFSYIPGKRILRLAFKKEIEAYYCLDNLDPYGLAYKNGLLFICAVETDWKSGSIIAVYPDKKQVTAILSSSLEQTKSLSMKENS